MNLDAAAVVLRPRTVSEVFDLACRLGAGPAANAYAKLGLWLLLPFWLACLALRAAGLDWIWVWLAAIVCSAVLQGPFTVATGRILFSELVTVRQSLRAYLARMHVHLGALTIFLLLLVAVGWTWILAPWAYVRMLFLHEVSLLEGLSGSAVATRCNTLIAGRGGPALAVVLLLWIARAAGVLIAELLGHAVVDYILQLGTPFGSLFEDGGSPYALLGFCVSIPYVAAARFLQYIDTRTRMDGWDIQLKFMAISAREKAEGSGP